MRKTALSTVLLIGIALAILFNWRAPVRSSALMSDLPNLVNAWAERQKLRRTDRALASGKALALEIPKSAHFEAAFCAFAAGNQIEILRFQVRNSAVDPREVCVWASDANAARKFIDQYVSSNSPSDESLPEPPR